MTWKAVLEKEHLCTHDSFVYQLGCNAVWDQQAYENLFQAMKECCKQHNSVDEIPRWIAELFWYLDWWVQKQVESFFTKDSNYNFYMDNAVVNFNHLACWLFMAEAREDDDFESIF